MSCTPRARSAPWIAGFLVAGAAIFSGCVDKDSGADPLRIPWNQHRGSAPGIQPGAASDATAVAAAAPVVEGGDVAAGSEELRALHSPLESGSVGHQSAAEHGCRTASCHWDLSPGVEIHSRIAAATCTRCHLPVNEPEEHRFRLVDTDGGVCRTCHVPHKGVATTHAPFREQRCLACHSPHQSVATKLLRENDGSSLCAGCHETAQQGHVHGPFAEGKCLACHEAHESRFESLTRLSSAELCLGCHDKEIAVPGREHPLTNLAELLSASRFVHGAIRAGDCSCCHASHTAPNANLLREAYPPDFYQTWDPSHYALCFQCHSTELATEARTWTRTGFRDGDRNLHHLHVTREKGRSCRACHEVHATNVAFQMRECVPFGEWMLPIRFERRPNGGVCGAACHPEKDYDRTRPPPPDELTEPVEH